MRTASVMSKWPERHPTQRLAPDLGMMGGMNICRCDARYDGCDHGVPCPTPPPSAQGNPYFCTMCDQLRMIHISTQFDNLMLDQEKRRPLRINGEPIPTEITNGPAGDFARFCGETNPRVLAMLDAEESDGLLADGMMGGMAESDMDKMRGPWPDAAVEELHRVGGMAEDTPQPSYCSVHQHYKWCEHNGGVMVDGDWGPPPR